MKLHTHKELTMTTVLTTADQIQAYQMSVVRQGLKALLMGMKINTSYTSGNCRLFVSNLTGVKYPSGKKGLNAALLDLEAKIGEGVERIRSEEEVLS